MPLPLLCQGLCLELFGQGGLAQCLPKMGPLLPTVGGAVGCKDRWANGLIQCNRSRETGVDKLMV